MPDDPAYADGAAFMDGAYMPVADCKIPVLDWGFLRGDATYDVVHTWNGPFFRLEEHLDRFDAQPRAPALLDPVRPRRHRRGAAPLRRADGPAATRSSRCW